MKKLLTAILVIILMLSFVAVYAEDGDKSKEHNRNTVEERKNENTENGEKAREQIQERKELFIDKDGDGIHDDIENMIMNKLQSRIKESIQQKIRNRLRFAFSRAGSSMPRHIRSRTDFSEKIGRSIYNPF
ncbi:MAG: hypothetical protein R6U31_00465 [bacterium]